MPFVKTPTSSLTATELLVNKAWYRSKAYLEQLYYRSTPELPTQHPSPIARLPQELVETIISHLFYDSNALSACSMTCYSWYIATVPYLHYYLTTNDEGVPDDRKEWPTPLCRSYRLGLLPFVRQLCVRHIYNFTPKLFRRSTLLHFSALTNLQDLGIDGLQVSSFMPNIQRYFGHFAPSLRFLALRQPEGSCRQILYFIGLFPNLQDLKLCYPSPEEEQESTIDPELTPLSIPPLRGRLTLTCFAREQLVKDMITFFGGLRFRYMDLFRVKCTRLLLHACAETLETLRLYPTDLHGGGQTQTVSQHFNLSRNKSLRTLETTAGSIAAAAHDASEFDAPGFLKTVLSTIKSPLPLDVVIVHREFEVGRHRWDWRNPSIRSTSAVEEARIVQRHSEQFTVFREMYGVREFRLMLCADVPQSVEKDAMDMLERIVEEERNHGGLDSFLHGVSIISERRTHRFQGCSTGTVPIWPIYASAL